MGVRPLSPLSGYSESYPIDVDLPQATQNRGFPQLASQFSHLPSGIDWCFRCFPPCFLNRCNSFDLLTYLRYPNMWDGLATPVPEVRDFWKKASYEWRRRLASASRLALRWPLLPPFARRQCPRLTPAQRPEVCHPPRVLTAQVRPTATPAHLSRCLSGMASRSD